MPNKPKSPKVTRLHVRIPVTDAEALETEAANRLMPVSVLVREILARHIRGSKIAG